MNNGEIQMARITHHKAPRQSQMFDYAANVYQGNEFVICVRYEGYSGTAVHDEIKFLRKEYPVDKGYRIEW